MLSPPALSKEKIKRRQSGVNKSPLICHSPTEVNCRSKISFLEMQIKTLRFYCTPVRVAKSQNTDATCWRGHGAAGARITAGGGAAGGSRCGRQTAWVFLPELNTLLPHDPEILLLKRS